MDSDWVTPSPRGDAVPVKQAQVNPIATRADWEAARSACTADPGAFHAGLAKRELHWFAAACNAWLTWNEADQAWQGFDATSGAHVRPALPADFAPWSRAFNGDDAPFWRWFEGGRTNACFNEQDRHVLAGHGGETALIFEGDRWDMSAAGGRGAPLECEHVSRRALLLETAKRAIALRRLGLRTGDRIALNMPNILEQIYWTEAAKREGVIYTPVFGGFAGKTLSDRIADAGARVVITADGGYRMAQIVPFKMEYTDAALDNYVPVGAARQVAAATLERLAVAPAARDAINAAIAEALAGEVTVERGDVMRGAGRALTTLSQNATLAAAEAARIRIALAQALMEVPHSVQTVVVVRHTGQPNLTWRTRDRWSHELVDAAATELIAAAAAAGFPVTSEADLLALPDADFVRAIWQAAPVVPVDGEFPMFFIYTSGSTGKPKGVVHVHGGYTAGIAASLRVAFDARPGDVIYVIADPGWITGQSYMICAPLITRVTSIIAEGTPVFPHNGRFAAMIERYGVTIFKAGVTFLKTVMQDSQSRADIGQYDLSSLRVATFCAEPTSPTVQQFGMSLLTPWYINSYWASEHGGIVWTHFYGNADFPLRADAHAWPLPWVLGDVWVEDEGDGRGALAPLARPDQDGRTWRRAAAGEKGEIVIAAPYPYLARTVWGDAAHFDGVDGRVSAGWRGDAARWRGYWTAWRGAWAYTQGDFAIQHDDGSFSFHGRSDDVINVSGHRMGTEEIEGAILRDRALHPDSPVANVIVVGAPHREKGLIPLAFIKVAEGQEFKHEDRRRLIDLVRQEKGAVAVPGDFIEVSQFPETRSGKYMRRMVRALVEDAPVGDASTLRNPEAIDELRAAIAAWRQRARLAEAQTLFDRHRYFRVQYTRLTGAGLAATVFVTNPPVNALNERALDELAIVVQHLARREDVRAVIFTGDGASSFVAGADIRQFLEEITTIEEARLLPNTAHLAFRLIESMDKPAIAAIQGVALGGGMEFALACHLRLAELQARFGQPEIRLNLLPGYGGTQRLPRLLAAQHGAVGLEMALDMLMSGRSLDGEAALRAGVVDVLVPEGEDVLSLAHAMVRDFAELGEASALGQAMMRRRVDMAAWDAPGKLPLAETLAAPRLRGLRDQAAWAGREAAMARLLDAVGTGWNGGVAQGFAREAALFAEAIIDPAGGKTGIRAFIDKKSPPLPVKRDPGFILASDVAAVAALRDGGKLLPVGAAFYPGITPIPAYQYAFGVTKDMATGAPAFGPPKFSEREVIVPVDRPGPTEALVYMLASEVNFNDIWCLTGIPVSAFDNHERDVQVTGSGGVGLLVALGSEARREGRLKIGDLVCVYSGTSNLLSPYAARDPMSADFAIQGYETETGSHAQFLVTQAPQLHPVPGDLTLEQAGSYVLNLGTITRALFTTLQIERGRTMLVEGAATGTGLEAMKSAALHGVRVTGLASGAARCAFVRAQGGAAAIDRQDPGLAALFTPVPEDPEAALAWERDGEKLLDVYRHQNDGRLADYVVSHAGETAFSRSFQLLAEGGKLTFYGASSGYHFSFIGKPGQAAPQAMLARAGLHAGESVLLYYAPRSTALLDETGLEMLEAVRACGARAVLATSTDAQRDFVLSLGFETALSGIVSLEDIARREGAAFDWPAAMPRLPNARQDIEAFKAAVRDFQERTIKPFGGAVGRLLKSEDNPRGAPDLVLERAGHDTLGVSTSLVKPFTGRVVYAENMAGRRYSFYAPQVWTRQRRILMPTASILGTHLCNAFEVTRMNDMIAAGLLRVTEPTLVPWADLPKAHQAMWDNAHAGATYVVNHALPATGLRGKFELLENWFSLEGNTP